MLSRTNLALGGEGEPVLPAVDDMDVAGPEVGQPPLQLLRPGQPQAGRHHDQQWPLLLHRAPIKICILSDILAPAAQIQSNLRVEDALTYLHVYQDPTKGLVVEN